MRTCSLFPAPTPTQKARRKRHGICPHQEHVYALDAVVEGHRSDLLGILEPYITRGDDSTLAAFNSAIGSFHESLVHRLLPHLEESQIGEAFQHACTQSPSMVNTLLPTVPDAIRSDTITRCLEDAVTGGKVEPLRSLIRGRPNLNAIMVNEQDECDQRTYLHWLGMWGLWTHEINGSVEAMVKLFCKAGANVSVKDDDGLTPLHHFAESGARRVKPHLLLEDDNTNQGLDFVYARILKYLIKAGADINAKDKKGRTPLHLAVINEEPIMVTILLAAGVNSLIRDNEGNRASNVAGSTIATLGLQYKMLWYEQKQERERKEVKDAGPLQQVEEAL